MKWKCIIVMGVSGCGKSTIGSLVAQRLDARFLEGDDFHSAANVEKMEQGIPLTDEDRLSWLRDINSEVIKIISLGESCVVSCSALTRGYRNLLRNGIKSILFVYLKGSYAVIKQRLLQREGHFMPVALLRNQFETLEEPGAEEKDIVTVDIVDRTLDEEMDCIMTKLK